MVHGIVYSYLQAVLINCRDILSLPHGCHSDIFSQIIIS